MIDKIIGAILLLAVIIGLVYVVTDTMRGMRAVLRDERLARIAANERCYKSETWACYMDEKIRREKAEAERDELKRKLDRANDTMSRAKLKHKD